MGLRWAALHDLLSQSTTDTSRSEAIDRHCPKCRRSFQAYLNEVEGFWLSCYDGRNHRSAVRNTVVTARPYMDHCVALAPNPKRQRKQTMTTQTTITRRECLAVASVALGGLPLLPTSAGGVSTPSSSLIRLSLNENPFGPAREAKEKVRQEMERICRYPDRTDLLAETIAARERVPGDQIVLGEILAPLEKPLRSL